MPIPLIAMQGETVDVTGALQQYGQARQTEIGNQMNAQKLDMMQEQHDMSMARNRQAMDIANQRAARAQAQADVNQELQVLDMMGKYADRADTPHKWRAYIDRVKKIWGEDSVKGFEDFANRPNAMQLVKDKRTALIQNYEYRQHLPPEQQAHFDKVAQKGGVNVNLAAGEKQEQKKLGEFRVKKYEQGDADKGRAIQNLTEYQVLEEAANDPELHQGVMGPSVQGVKRTMKEVFGLEVGGTTSGEIIQKANTRLIQEAIKVQGRGFSDADLKFAQKAQPGLADSKQAFQISIGMAKRAEHYKIKMQEFREDYLAEHGTLKGVQKGLRDLDRAYVKNTKADLRTLREIAKSYKQTLPTAGMDKAMQSLYDEYGMEQ